MAGTQLTCRVLSIRVMSLSEAASLGCPMDDESLGFDKSSDSDKVLAVHFEIDDVKLKEKNTCHETQAGMTDGWTVLGTK